MAYSLSTHYAGQGLLDNFSFFTGRDPTSGFVDYLSRDEAVANNLVSIDELGRVKLGVDAINTYSTSDRGRPSVRLTSNDTFAHGLFIADFAHMPSSTCGTWPAFWVIDDEGNSSARGEISIIEGANTAQRNLFSAHTAAGCRTSNTGFIGAQGPTDCSSSVGCNFAASVHDATTYGDAFNAQGGGVYALEWNSQDVRIWHFPRTAIPDNINSAPLTVPDPTTWGPPQALFGGPSCEADSYFHSMSLAINTNFCGLYAGDTWRDADQCAKLAPTCEEYVAKNPSRFQSSFWQINYIDVYQKPAPTHVTAPLQTPSDKIIPKPLVSTITSSPVPKSNTAIPTRTRTITISTATKSVPATTPTQADGRLVDPATIDGWTLLGCFGSLAGRESFSQAASFPAMDNQVCVTSCTGHKYAGVSGEACYCADSLGETTALANNMCDIPCPGDSHASCGGVLSVSESTSSPPSFAGVGVLQTNATAFRDGAIPANIKSSPHAKHHNLLPRIAPSSILMTVYGNVRDDVPPHAPGMRAGPHHYHHNLSHPHGSEEHPTVTNTVVTVTFATICPTDARSLITLEYCTTLTAERLPPGGGRGATTVQAAIPMTTYAEACDACGPHGERIVTLTVPQAMASGRGGAHVMAIAEQTVSPIPFTISSSSSSSSSSMITTTAATVTASNSMYTVLPVAGAGAGAPTVSGAAVYFLRTLGYGLALWFGVFTVGVIM